jgi:hypothetical protein
VERSTKSRDRHGVISVPARQQLLHRMYRAAEVIAPVSPTSDEQTPEQRYANPRDFNTPKTLARFCSRTPDREPGGSRDMRDCAATSGFGKWCCAKIDMAFAEHQPQRIWSMIWVSHQLMHHNTGDTRCIHRMHLRAPDRDALENHHPPASARSNRGIQRPSLRLAARHAVHIWAQLRP